MHATTLFIGVATALFSQASLAAALPAHGSHNVPAHRGNKGIGLTKAEWESTSEYAGGLHDRDVTPRIGIELPEPELIVPQPRIGITLPEPEIAMPHTRIGVTLPNDDPVSHAPDVVARNANPHVGITLPDPAPGVRLPELILPAYDATID